MLYFLVVWSILLFLCVSSGLWGLTVTRAKAFQEKGDRFIVAIWVGISLLCLTLLAISLLFPLSPPNTLPVLVAFTTLGFLSSQSRREILSWLRSCTWQYLIGWLTLCSGIGFLIARNVIWFDSGYYHVGAIRWLAEYGTIPGVSLIHYRFAWISSWFALNAALNPPFVNYRATASANGFILVIAILHFLISVNYIARSQSKLSHWFAFFAYLILLPLFIFKNLPFIHEYSLMAELMISPSPDIAIALLIMVIAMTILICAQSQEFGTTPSLLDSRLIPLLLSISAVTIKLTALPIILITLPFYIFRRHLFWQRLIFGCFFTAIGLIPFFSAGMIASGCPLAPTEFMCFDVPWSTKPPFSWNIILAWRDSHLLGLPSLQENYWLWVLPKWFQKSQVNSIIGISTLISLLLGIWIFILAKKRKIKGLLVVSLIGISGGLMVLNQAPDTRYGLGYFILIPSLILGTIGYLLSSHMHLSISNCFRKAASKRWSLIAFRFLSFFSLGLVGIWGFQGWAESRLFLPPSLPTVEVIRDQVNDVQYVHPVKPSLCWATAPPCALGLVRFSVKFRDSSQGYRGGFTLSSH